MTAANAETATFYYRVDLDTGKHFFVIAKSHTHATGIAGELLKPPMSGRPGEWIEKVTQDPRSTSPGPHFCSGGHCPIASYHADERYDYPEADADPGYPVGPAGQRVGYDY